MNLSNVDLDLFVVLQAVLEEGSATRAAARLHVTRPAVSNALARLRRVLNDQLFVRTARGLMPTPRAKEIAPLVASALEQLRAVVDETSAFDPSTSTRRFTIACSDNEQIAVLPPVVERFHHRLPLASLRITTIEQAVVTDGLGTGEVDAMIGVLPSVPASLRAEILFTDRLVCIARRVHGTLRRKLKSDEFWQLSHVEIALLGGRPTFGSRLSESIQASQGRTVHVALTAPNFVFAAVSVSRTDWLAVLPARLAAALSAFLPLQVLDVPFEVPSIPTHLVWHARSDKDLGAKFFRKMIVECAGNLKASKTRRPKTAARTPTRRSTAQRK